MQFRKAVYVSDEKRMIEGGELHKLDKFKIVLTTCVRTFFVETKNGFR